MTPLTDSEALDAIRASWLTFARHAIDPFEALAEIAEALERSSRPLIAGDATTTANDPKSLLQSA